MERQEPLARQDLAPRVLRHLEHRRPLRRDTHMVLLTNNSPCDLLPVSVGISIWLLYGGDRNLR